MNGLATLDIAVILIYLLGIVIYGISKSKRSSSEDYFLGGRTMTWPIVGIASEAKPTKVELEILAENNAIPTIGHVMVLPPRK